MLRRPTSPHGPCTSLAGVLGVFLVFAHLLVRADPAATAPPPAPPPPALRRELLGPGRFVFERHCVLCHGRRGNGKGELAPTTFPRPRDFTRGLFKFRSTPSGSLPTEEDLARTIQGGLTGTAMPAFSQLPERDIRAVIEHLKSLSPRWTNAAFHLPPVALPPPPDWLSDHPVATGHARRGETLFQAACAPCHGMAGAGDGPAAESLRDAWDHPCPPRDLRVPILRAGSSPEAIYRTLVTGLDGTPMPSFLDMTTVADRWDLVAFILELRSPPR